MFKDNPAQFLKCLSNKISVTCYILNIKTITKIHYIF